jgi:hypothetical protein
MRLSQLVACIVASVVMWFGIGTMAMLGTMVAQAKEGNALGNCHIYGDGRCGESAPWHGFTGATPEEPMLKCARGFRVETIDGLDHITCENVI